MDWTPITEFVTRNWFFTLLLGIIGWLSREIFKLHEEKISLKVGGDSLKERNSESLNEIRGLKAENLSLRSKIQEKQSDEAMLAEYDIDEKMGLAHHKKTQKPHCLQCLMDTPRRQVPLIDRGEYWMCSRWQHNHHQPDKPGRRGWHMTSAND